MLFIHYPKCTTCKRAKMAGRTGRRLHRTSHRGRQSHGGGIESLARKSGLPLKRFFNTSGMKYRELGLKDKLKDMSEEEQYALLSTDGMLVKRPLLIYDDGVLVGFKEKEWEEKI